MRDHREVSIGEALDFCQRRKQDPEKYGCEGFALKLVPQKVQAWLQRQYDDPTQTRPITVRNDELEREGT